jgi:outer membrane protein assembly factor BamB
LRHERRWPAECSTRFERSNENAFGDVEVSMSNRSGRAASVLAASAVAVSVLSAQDWNQWRGPSRTGVAVAFRPPVSWPDRATQVWKVPAGIGHASPVVADGRIYLISRLGEREAVTSYDLATGKQVWRQTYDAPYQVNSAAATHGKGPKSTPAQDRGRVFTFGISGVLSAWQAKDGQLLWRKDFRKEFPRTSPDYGVAVSPLVVNDVVIVHAGGSGSGALMALESASGSVRWSWNGDGPAYASPIVARFSGVPQVITQSQRHIVAVGLPDGRPLWQIPFTTDFDQNILTPVVVDDLLIYSGNYRPLTAVRVVQQAGKWSTTTVWQNEALPSYMSTPVVVGDTVYGLTQRNRGQFFAADVRSGKTLWTTRGREGDNAALVTWGDLLIAATTEGELVVARAGRQAFDVIRRYTVADSPVWAHPVPAANGVLIKDTETLAYYTF